MVTRSPVAACNPKLQAFGLVRGSAGGTSTIVMGVSTTEVLAASMVSWSSASSSSRTSSLSAGYSRAEIAATILEMTSGSR